MCLAMRIHEAIPTGPVRGAVVVIQEAFGVNAHIEDLVQRLADAGYHAVAPDLFHRQGGKVFGYTDDFAEILKIFVELDDTMVLADLDAAIAHLHAAGFANDQIGTVGFCFGGRASFLLAADRKLGAAVGFYGGGIVTERSSNFPALIQHCATLQTPWLGLFGDADGSIPVDTVEQLREELAAKAAVANAIVRYPDAPHGFNCDRRADYRPDDAADAWAKTLDWFETHLARTPDRSPDRSPGQPA